MIFSTYTIFERDSGGEDRVFFYNRSFNYFILDEAHCIKNNTSSRHYNLNKINAKHRLLLSGTPVQNDVSELLSLLSFLMPKVFGTQDCLSLLESFEGPDPPASSGPSLKSSRRIQQLRSMLAPFVLRRLKTEVLTQLVPKTTVVEKVEMTEFQAAVYRDIIRRYAEKKDMKVLASKENAVSGKQKEAVVIDLCASPAPPLSPSMARDTTTEISKDSTEVTQFISTSDMKHVFTALRKAANHPLLLRVRYQDSKVMDKIARVAHAQGHFGQQCDVARVRQECDTYSDYDLHQLCTEYPKYLGKYTLPEEALYDSPKMRRLRSLIPSLLVRVVRPHSSAVSALMHGLDYRTVAIASSCSASGRAYWISWRQCTRLLCVCVSFDSIGIAQ